MGSEEFGALKDIGSSVAAAAARDFLKGEAERRKAYQELQKILIKNDRVDWLKKRALPLPPIPLTPEQKEEFFECFELMDPDETGFVEAGKLISAFSTIGVSLFQKSANAKSFFYDNELGAGHATKLRCDDFIVIMSRALARETLEKEGRASRKGKQECLSFVEAIRALRRKKLIEALTAGGEHLERVVEQLDKAREAAIQSELAELNAERHLDKERMQRKQELEHMASLPRQVLRQMSQAARRHALHAEVTKNEQVPDDDDSELEERLQDPDLPPERLLSTRTMMQQVQQEDRALKKALSRHNSFASLAHLVPKNLPKGSFQNVVASVVTSLHASRAPSEGPSNRSSLRGSRVSSLRGSRAASLRSSRGPSQRSSLRGSGAVSRRGSRRGSDEVWGPGARPGSSSPPIMLQALKRLGVAGGSQSSNRSDRSRPKAEMSVRWGDEEDSRTDAKTELLWPTGTPKGSSRSPSPFEHVELSLNPSMNPRSIHASEDGAGAGAQGAEKNGQQQQQQMEEQQRQRRQLLLQQQQQQAPSPEASATEFQGFPSGGLQADTQPGLASESTKRKVRKRASFRTPSPEVSQAPSKAAPPIPGEGRPESLSEAMLDLSAAAGAAATGGASAAGAQGHDSQLPSRGGTPEPTQASRPRPPPCLKISSPASASPCVSAVGNNQAAGSNQAAAGDNQAAGNNQAGGRLRSADPRALDTYSSPASTPFGRTTSTEESPFGRRTRAAPDEMQSMLSPGAESTPQSSKPPPRLSWAGSRPKRGSLRRSRDDSIRIHNPFKDYESDEDEVFAFWRREQRARRRARLEAERQENRLLPSPERPPGTLSSSEADVAAGLRNRPRGRRAASSDDAKSWDRRGGSEANRDSGSHEGGMDARGDQPSLVPRWPGWVWVGGTKGWRKQREKRRTLKDLDHEPDGEHICSRRNGKSGSSAARSRDGGRSSKRVGKGEIRGGLHGEGGASIQDAMLQQDIPPSQSHHVQNELGHKEQDGQQENQNGHEFGAGEHKEEEHVHRGRQQGKVSRSAHAQRVEQLKKAGEDPLQAFKESISQRHASMATAGESRYTTSRIGRRLQAGGLAFFGYLRDEIMQQEERIQCKMKSSFAVNAPKVPQPSDAWVQAITRPQSRICESMGGSVRSTLTSRCSSDSIPQRSHHLSANGMPPHPGSVRAATAPHTTRARRDVHSAHASTAPLCLSRGLYGLAPARQEPAEPANLDAGAPDDFENAALSMAATPKPCPDQVPTSSSAPLGSQPATSTHPLAASAPCLSLSPSHTDQAFTPVTGTAEDHPQTSVKPPPTHMTQSVSGTIPARPSTAAAHAGMPGQMLANTKSSRASSARAPLPHSPFMGPALHSEPTFQHSPTSSHSGTGHAHHGSSGFGSAGRHARCVDGAVRTVEGLHQPVLDSSLVSTFPKRTTSAGPSPPGSPNFSPSRVRSRSSSPPSRPDSAAEDANTPHDEYHPWVKPGQFARFPERTACTGQPLDTPEAAATATVHAALESSFNNVSKTGHSFRKVPAHMSRVQGCTASGVGGGGGGGGDDVSRVHPNISPAAAHPITATAGSSTSSPGTAALRPSHQHPQHHVHPVQSANTTKTFVATSTMSQGGPEGGRIHRKSQESTVLAHSAQISGRESAAHTQSTQMLGQGSLLQPTPSHTVAPPDLRSLAASAKGATLSARSTHPHEHTPSRHSGSIHAGGPAPSAGPASIVAASEPDDDSSSHAHPLHPLGKKADAGPRRRARRASSPSGLSRHRTPTALSGMRLKGLKKWTSGRLGAPGGGLHTTTILGTPLESLVGDMTPRSNGSLGPWSEQPRAASDRNTAERRSTFSGACVQTGAATLGMGPGLIGGENLASMVYCRVAPSFSTNTRYRCEADGCSSYRRRLSQALAIPFDTEDDGDVSDLAENASKGLSTYRSSLGTINSTGKGVAGADMRAECAQPAKHLCERSSTQEDVWISSSRSSGRVQEDRYGIRNSRAASSVDSQDEECGGPPIWMAGALSRLASPTAGQHSPGGSRSRHASPEKSGSRHGSPEKPGIQPQSPSSSMLASSMQSVGHGAPQLFDVTSHAVLPGATSATAQPALDLTHATPGAPTPHPPLLSNSTPPLLHTPPVSVSGHPAHVPHTPPPLPAPPTAHTSPSLAQPLGASSHSTGPSHHTLHLLPQLAPPAAVHQHPPLAVYHPTHQHLRVDSPSSPRAVALSQQQVSMPATAPYPLHQQPPQTAAASTEQLGSPPLQQSAAPAAHGEKQHRPRTLSPPPSSDQAHPLARSLANYNALPFVQGVHKTGGTQNSMQGGAEMAEQHQQQQQQQQQKDHTVLHPAQGAGGKPAVEQLRSQARAAAAAAAAATPPDTSDHDVGRPPIHAHTGLTPTSTPTKMAAGLVTKGLSRVASAATAPAASTTPVVTKGGLHSPSHMHSLRASPQSPRAPTQENTAQQNSALTEGPAHGDPRPSSLKPAHVPRLSLQSQQHQHPQQHHPQQQHQQLLTQHMRLQSAQQQHAKPLSLPYQKPAWRPSTAQPQPQTAQSAAAALAEMVRRAQQAEDAANAEAASRTLKGVAPPLFWKQPAMFKGASVGDERPLKSRMAQTKKEAALGSPETVDTHQVLVGGEVYTLLLRSDGTCYGKQRAHAQPDTTTSKPSSHKAFWAESLAEGIKAYAYPATTATQTTSKAARDSASEASAAVGSATMDSIQSSSTHLLGPSASGGSAAMNSVQSPSVPLVHATSACQQPSASQAPAHAPADRPTSPGPLPTRAAVSPRGSASSASTSFVSRASSAGGPGHRSSSGALSVSSASSGGAVPVGGAAPGAAPSDSAFQSDTAPGGSSSNGALCGSAAPGGGAVLGGAWGMEELQQQQQQQQQQQFQKHQRQQQQLEQLQQQQQQRFAHATSRSMSACPARKWDKVVHNHEVMHAAAGGKRGKLQEHDKAGRSAAHSASPSPLGSMSRVFGGSRLRNASARPKANSLFRSEPQPLWNHRE